MQRPDRAVCRLVVCARGLWGEDSKVGTTYRRSGINLELPTAVSEERFIWKLSTISGELFWKL